MEYAGKSTRPSYMEVAPSQVFCISNVHMLVVVVDSGHYMWTSQCDILNPNLSSNRMKKLETFLVCGRTLVICLDNIQVIRL
jgi:hypothetical protein